MKEVLKTIGLKVMEGDEAFYYLHRNGELIGTVVTHVDDFTLAGTEAYINEVLETVFRELTVSKIERDNFRYTGIDVKTIEDGIEVEREDYVDSLEEVRGCPYITLSVIMGGVSGKRLCQFNMVGVGGIFVINFNGKGVSKR